MHSGYLESRTGFEAKKKAMSLDKFDKLQYKSKIKIKVKV